MNAREHLNSIVLSRADVERFLTRAGADGLQPNDGTTFDGELGWVHADAVNAGDGVGKSRTFCYYEADGARRVVHGRGVASRINTYGDSFTHGNQVNDGETWQEVLAAHLQEPIRNYGVSGYSVYQAYRRMLKVEREGAHSARYVILMLFDDDHFRNLDAWRPLRVGRMRRGMQPHLRVNLATGECRECDNPLPRPEDVYRLCDPERVWTTFRDDPILPLRRGAVPDYGAVAASFGLPPGPPPGGDAAGGARALHLQAALLATRHVLALTERFIQETDRQLMVILAYGRENMAAALREEPAFDQHLLDYLASRPYPVIDMREMFLRDYRESCLEPGAYLDRFYIGHLTPVGNHFTAWAIKDRIVEWLHPRPAPYAT